MTNEGATHLLKHLEPAVRPTASTKSTDGRGEFIASKTGAVDAGYSPFQHLIELAMGGELTTGRKVAANPGIEISNDDLSRIAAAADRAEAAGGRMAVVLMHGQGFILDIERRRVTESLISPHDDSPVGRESSNRLALLNNRWIVSPDLEDKETSKRAVSFFRSETGSKMNSLQSADPFGLSSSGRITSNNPAVDERIISGIDTAIIINDDGLSDGANAKMTGPGSQLQA